MQSYVNKYLGKNQQSKFDTYLESIRRERVLKSINVRPHKHILDIGSGIATYFAHIRDWDSYTIVEPIKQFSDHLKKYYDNYDINIACDKFENTNLDKDFDFVIVSSVLHLVENPDIFLTALHNICNYKTIVHINVPNMVSFHRLLGGCMGIIDSIDSLSEKDMEFSHKTMFDKESLLEILSCNGFNILTQGSYLIKPFDDEKMSLIVDKELIVGLEKMISYFPNMGCEIYAEAKAIK